MQLDTSKVQNIEFEGIDYSDYPDFCDAFISFATYDGESMTAAQLDAINEDRSFVHMKLFEHLF